MNLLALLGGWLRKPPKEVSTPPEGDFGILLFLGERRTPRTGLAHLRRCGNPPPSKDAKVASPPTCGRRPSDRFGRDWGFRKGHVHPSTPEPPRGVLFFLPSTFFEGAKTPPPPSRSEMGDHPPEGGIVEGASRGGRVTIDQPWREGFGRGLRMLFLTLSGSFALRAKQRF
ncbi:hypothetical protein RRG08_057346 [Elysia crispata]|uniref:Uncharacterized protein n=1 Tax=Elysia crispata TaxID=231223 RepID=A0AAE0YJF1_9GAST|nr:hypothetical protein RRG08_057346 [Elysia crispata]